MKIGRTKWALVALAALGLVGLGGCDDKPSGTLAPVSSALAPAKPHSKVSVKFEVEQKSSHVGFLMAAPIERIEGKAPGSVSGDLYVDLSDLERSNGLVKVDLDQLVLYQSRRKTAQDKFGDEQKNDRQNEHMKTWLQVSDDAPPAIRQQNRYVEFKIDKIDHVSNKNVLAMKGDERKVTMTVSGDFRLHGRKVKKTAELAVTFKFSGTKPTSVHVETVKPIPVGLREHDIKPRETFEKLASKTLSALGSKVAESAPVTLDFDARPAK